MPQVIAKHESPRKPVLVASIAVGLMIVIIVGVVVWINIQAQEQQAAQKQKLVTQEAQYLDNHGQYGKERDLLQTYISSNPPKKYHYSVDIKLGDLTYNARDDKDSLKWYTSAQQVTGKPQLLDVLGIEQAEEAMGDKTVAISDLKEAIKLTQAATVDQASIPSLVASYQSHIRALGGTP